MKYFIPVSLLALLILAGCGGNENAGTAPEATGEAIELTADEAELLDTAQEDTTTEEPITPENYEEALQELEEAVESDQ